MPTDDGLDLLASEAQRLGLPLDGRAHERFERYLALIGAWRERAGLTAIEDPGELQRRLFAESLALLVALREAGVLEAGRPTAVADIGTGAGIPGLPMRIVEPALGLTLIESHGRRCRFLETVVEELELGGVADGVADGSTDRVTVRQARAEEAGRDPALREAFDLAVARAVAPLPVLVEYALPLLRPGGVLAAPKGSRARDELREAAGAIEALGGCAEEPLALPLPSGAPPQLVLLVRRCGELPERYPRRPGMPSKRPLS